VSDPSPDGQLTDPITSSAAWGATTDAGQSMPPESLQRRHILTVALEDYFQVGAFNRFVQRNQWYRFETRLEQNTARVLELLNRYQAKATFFTLGWVAARFPELLQQVAKAGHEVAIKGYYHRGIRDMTPAEFEADAERARAAAHEATGQAVVGYRLADGWIGEHDLWALDVLTRVGFDYDSSLAPIHQRFAKQPYRETLHPHQAHGRTLWEVPISTAKILGCRIPVAGGNYLRQLPGFLTRRATHRWVKTHSAPLVAYFHAWELDPDQPRLSIGGPLTRLRHYRNLHRMEERLSWLLASFQFTSVADFLGIDTTKLKPIHDHPRNPEGRSQKAPAVPIDFTKPRHRTPVSIVVPCFNEEDVLPYLANTLERVAQALSEYEVQFILIDDGSHDRTWDGLNATFGNKPGFELIQHRVNRGVAAAILTGLRAAKTEIVCSMDCDCTYDPVELVNMIPLLKPGVDLVTASPYHPAGKVRNVPRWRLGLSRGASWLYRRVLRTKLHTYTSCFRVYRRSACVDLHVKHGRFLGIAEMLGLLDLDGGTIVEHPATLEVRLLGRSKIQTLRTIVGHLGLLLRFAVTRLRHGWFRPGVTVLPLTDSTPIHLKAEPVELELRH
jgi:polysaccharide deacetylase family protein (PEP-CTERM system associated)